MFVSLSFEETKSNDVSIMVDAFRASTTITLAFNNFNQVIPAFSPEDARKIAKKYNSILVGERLGEKLKGFHIGNSPEKVANYETDKKSMVITTTNGTRILENMNSTILVGCFVNAKAVAIKASEIASSHIDLVMAGRKGNFALEDYLACGEILYWIKKYNTNIKFSEYALSSIMASQNKKQKREYLLETESAKILKELGYIKDVEFCMQSNITDNVAIFENNEFRLL